MLLFLDTEFDPQTRGSLDLMVERIEALPMPAVLDDMFADSGIGLIWIPAPGRHAAPLREWTPHEKQQVRLAEQVVGQAIGKEMDDTGCRVIQKVFEDGSQVVLYRQDAFDVASRISGVVVAATTKQACQDQRC